MSYAYFHRDGKGAWHGYDAKTNAAIEAARPLEATLTLRYPDNPEKYRTFEIRFGAKAVSRRLKSPPSSGIIQVNVADENTRSPARARGIGRRAAGRGGARRRGAEPRGRRRGAPLGLEDGRREPRRGAGGGRDARRRARRTHAQVSAGRRRQDGDAVVLDEVGKGSFFSSSPTASHRLRFAGGGGRRRSCGAGARDRLCANQPANAAAQPFRLLREPPAWALDEAAARAAEDREHWRARCGGAPEQLELTLNAGRVALKDADDRVLAPPPPPAGGLGLMGAIAARLAERRGSIAMTPMDESDSDSDGDWD
ncbi:hypothetical protein SO694_00129080 [Aureococcus anophagefferens]|uniref:WWE domain-containing protein n=1 Tax=Aureococcus anophagefferens TaxID=44056 RepID=A0ABR1G535_AURAN